MNFFHPKRHIPPTNDMNMSKVEGYKFAVCRLIQYEKMPTECGGVNKYLFKYIGKNDEQNFVVGSTNAHKNRSLVSKGTFLYNNKVTTSNINQDKMRENRKDNNHSKDRVISQMKMLHVTLKYPEV